MIVQETQMNARTQMANTNFSWPHAKGLQAVGDMAPFPYIKGVAALALTVLGIVDVHSSPASR